MTRTTCSWQSDPCPHGLVVQALALYSIVPYVVSGHASLLGNMFGTFCPPLWSLGNPHLESSSLGLRTCDLGAAFLIRSPMASLNDEEYLLCQIPKVRTL